jgi:hypothetical protein
MMNATDRKTLTRRILIGIARKRQKPGSGSSQAFLRRRTALMVFPEMGPILDPIR